MANKHKLAVRSPIPDPLSKHIFFIEEIVAGFSVDNLKEKDIQGMIKFASEIVGFVTKYEKRPKMPINHNTIHYGPPPILPLSNKLINKKANKKKEDLRQHIAESNEHDIQR